MFNKAIIFINSILEHANINNNSLPDIVLNIITHIAWLAVDVLLPINSIGEFPLVFAPHHGRKSRHIPSSLMDKLTPKLVIVGETPSDELDYYSNYDTITQNTAGDILFETNGDYPDIFVSESNYKKTDGMVRNWNHGYHSGMHYLGSIKED